MAFRGTPQPIPQSVADMLRVAADHMEESGDDRCRLLRELSNGFACKGRRTDQWEATVAKFHVGMVTELCNTIAQTVVSELAKEILARLDQPLTQWFVIRETGKTRKTKTEFVYQCGILLTTDRRDPLTNLVIQMGEAAWGEFLDETIRARFESVIDQTLGRPYTLKRSQPTDIERLNRDDPTGPNCCFMTNCYWQLKLPRQGVVKHLGFSTNDI